MTNAKLQKKVKAVVDDFDVDGITDYSRMDAAVKQATGLQLDNKSLWALVNRAKSQVERVSFTLDD